MKFAHYIQTERLLYFNGKGYVVRHDAHPHTTWTWIDGLVTRQGHSVLVGTRQGLTDEAGFRIDTYHRPDTPPAFLPPIQFRER